ncbi:FecCD family ABC transporter permease [Spirochaeta cellobiosiphila]|uniref:FecCD family ABC transporter permease n=1 Tax=Spirochaeta cellobiosiphila TaxID=504483 RepID=UPI00048DDB00|nr:iron ABC transporter permease [Spirochaeta cellobiosiphila]
MNHIKRKTCLGIPLIFMILALTTGISINTGFTPIPILEIIKVFLFQGEPKYNLILLDFRLPRIVIALMTGMGLALSGLILQGITQNPLSGPGLLGINAGAGLIVVLSIALGGTMNVTSIYALPFFALFGGALSGFAIYLLSKNGDRGLHPIRLILNGVAIQAGIFALMSLIVIGFDDSQHEFLARWQAGSIWSSNWNYVKAMLPWIAVCVVTLFFKRKHLDILATGDDTALGLGLALKKEKAILLFLSIALAAVSVAFTGSISFIGLMGPHMARRLFGTRHAILIPSSALLGALFVLIADTIGRTIISPSEIPAGIMVSIIGAPYFILLMLKGRKKNL